MLLYKFGPQLTVFKQKMPIFLKFLWRKYFLKSLPWTQAGDTSLHSLKRQRFEKLTRKEVWCVFNTKAHSSTSQKRTSLTFV
jgi:hypothetical protein